MSLSKGSERYRLQNSAAVCFLKVNNGIFKPMCKIWFKVNYKDTGTTSVMSFWCFYCYSSHCSIAFHCYVEKVTASWKVVKYLLPAASVFA